MRIGSDIVRLRMKRNKNRKECEFLIFYEVMNQQKKRKENKSRSVTPLTTINKS